MRGFVALLGWEWRSHRAIAALMAVSILGLSLLFRSLFKDEGYWLNGAVVAVPAMWILFVGGLAADVFGCEFTGRRIETLALVPASLLKLWTAKATFVVLALIASIAWTLGCQHLTFAVFDIVDTNDHFDAFLVLFPQAAAFALPFLVMTMLMATVVERTLPALFLGVMATAAVCAGLDFLVRFVEPTVHRNPAAMVALWQGVGLAFAAAAVATFVKGRVQTEDRWRRWRVAGSAVGRLFLLLSAFVGWKYWTWQQLSPGDPDALIHAITTSPDGKWLAIGAMRKGNEAVGYTAVRVWTMPVESGAPLVEAGSDRWIRPVDAWNADGTLHLLGGSRLRRRFTVVDVDPATAAVLRTETFDIGDVPRASPGTEFPFWATRNGGTLYPSYGGGKFTRVIEWKDTKRSIVSRGGFTLSRRPGIVWYSPDNRRVQRLDVATGVETQVFESDSPLQHVHAAQDGSRLIVTTDADATVIDADTGAALGGSWPRIVAWPAGARDGRFVVTNDYGPHTLVELDTGRTFDLGDSTPLKQSVSPQIQELADGRVVAMSVTGHVDLLDASCHVIRRLYPPGADAR